MTNYCFGKCGRVVKDEFYCLECQKTHTTTIDKKFGYVFYDNLKKRKITLTERIKKMFGIK